MSPAYLRHLSGFVDRFTALTLFHVRERKHGWEERDTVTGSEDECDTEGKDGWKLDNVSVPVPAPISHGSQERCILL